MCTKGSKWICHLPPNATKVVLDSSIVHRPLTCQDGEVLLPAANACKADALHTPTTRFIALLTSQTPGRMAGVNRRLH